MCPAGAERLHLFVPPLNAGTKCHWFVLISRTSEFVFKALYLQVPLSQVTSEEGRAQGFLGVVSIKLRQVSFIKGLIYRVCNET